MSLRYIALAMAILAMSSVIAHTAHPDAGHAHDSHTHKCALYRVISSGEIPQIFSYRPFFRLSYVNHFIQPLLIELAVSAPKNSRAPPVV